MPRTKGSKNRLKTDTNYSTLIADEYSCAVGSSAIIRF